MKLKRMDDIKAEVDMTPMIDCVFLLLVFFMVSTTFNKQEADISFALPGTAEQSDAVEIPDEQIIQITEAGNVFLNDLEYDRPTDPNMPELIKTLELFRKTAEANKVPAMITIAPEDNVKQQRVVDVLNACTAAKIANVTFAVGDDEEG
ncbi:MAG: biopolymer transporter ExbD [Kiritimatiellia bacterium]|jgi:biopolymer transport protein ExbD|nr:biopolymer transporter ExbD [Kiritimatiellia bacterium]